MTLTEHNKSSTVIIGIKINDYTVKRSSESSG